MGLCVAANFDNKFKEYDRFEKEFCQKCHVSVRPNVTKNINPKSSQKQHSIERF